MDNLFGPRISIVACGIAAILLITPVVASGEMRCQHAEEVSVHCGRTPSGVVDPEGHLLLVFVAGEFVYFSKSLDGGQSFSKPVRINPVAEPVYTNGENRPKISLGAEGQIYVSWSKVTSGRFNGDIRFSRSLDSGTSFEAVKTINDDNLTTTHRFESMRVDDSGNIYLTWIDKRDLVAAKARGEAYRGAAIYYSVSRDNGVSFQPNRLVAANSCECCRIATAPAESGISIFWRHIFGENLRDHAFATLGPEGLISPMQKATSDGWHIDACPHHGPSIDAVGGGDDREYHLAWFTNGTERKGIYYGRRVVNGDDPVSVRAISVKPSASHPHLVSIQNQVWIAWKEFDGNQTLVKVLNSDNGGSSWGDERIVATTGSDSDHPFLLKASDDIYLSWFTRSEGYRIIRIRPESLK